MRQSTYDIIKSRDIFLSKNLLLLEDTYINNRTPMLCRCMICNKESYKTLDMVLRNKKCIHCCNNDRKNKRYNNRKLKYDYVYNYFKERNCTLLELEYKNNRTKMKYICECGKISYITFKDFKRGRRCTICGIYKISGDKNGSWDEFKVGQKLINKLRRKFQNHDIKRLLFDDPNFDNWLENHKKYEVDHIIPVKAFAILVRDYNLDRVLIKILINQRDNIQLLTKEENRAKGDQHNIMEAIEFLEVRGVFIEQALSA